VNRATRSIGVALTSCTVPAVGTPTFAVGENEVEFGVGIHGEPGRRRRAMARADEIVEEMVGTILADLGAGRRNEAILLVNGFGATPCMELYVVYHSARTLLARHGIRAARSLVGTYVTSLDMAGASISVTLADAEMLALWDAPVHTAALRWRM
jgi:dihydroxyacetone kinase-like protein